MTILVTGGAGYIGSHTVVELLNHDYKVVVVDDFSNSKPASLKRIEKITGKGFAFVEANIMDKDALREVFENYSIDAVIHFAAFKAVGESVAKPLKYYHNNIQGSVALLEVMEEYGVKQFVYSSSATVYGLNNPSPLKEDMPTNQATNPYGYSKLVNEQLIKDYQQAHPDWHAVILRYFNPIGAHESGLIGEDPQGIPNNLMPYITQVAVGKREELSIFGSDYPTPDGTGVRDYIHVVDLAQGHLKALEWMADQGKSGIFNLGTGQGVSVLDLVKAFETANEIEIPYQLADRRPGDIATCYADPSLAEEVLGWKANRSLIDMCRDSWRWQVTNPNGFDDDGSK